MDSFGLRRDVIEFIVDAAETLGMEKVVLFGSRATGNYAEKSDIDLAISGNRYHEYIEMIDDECPTLLSFDFINLSENLSSALKQRIEEEGVVLYG